MEIAEIKNRVINYIVNDIYDILPSDDPESLPDNWLQLSEELAFIASELHRQASRIASYAGIAKKKSNRFE